MASAAVSDNELTAAIEEMIDAARDDLSQLTFKAVRLALEAKFHVVLKPRKAWIKSQVNEIVRRVNAEDESEEESEEEEEKPKKKKKGKKGKAATKKDGKAKKKRKPSANNPFTKKLVLSDGLAAVLGMKEASRSEVTKAVWALLKNVEKDDEGKVLPDDLAEVFGMSHVNFKTMPRALSSQLTDPNPSTARSKRKVELDEDGKPRKRANTGLNKPKPVSADMAAFLGKSESSRPQIVKALWAHIKANNLQKETDKRVIECDDVLENLLGHKEVTMFSMNKYIGQHFV